MRHRTLMAVNLLETAVPTMRSQCTGVHSGFLDRTHTAVRLESLTYWSDYREMSGWVAGAGPAGSPGARLWTLFAQKRACDI